MSGQRSSEPTIDTMIFSGITAAAFTAVSAGCFMGEIRNSAVGIFAAVAAVGFWWLTYALNKAYRRRMAAWRNQDETDARIRSEYRAKNPVSDTELKNSEWRNDNRLPPKN